ncbi:hypothetical protein BaRGS_00017453 [Batillaria attramentaria]|uniref:Uncharacterized protein n=1 Tax=Batillaria attramentaria TaxID=370345 RepID=A0ABD0KX73_9CAEN
MPKPGGSNYGISAVPGTSSFPFVPPDPAPSLRGPGTRSPTPTLPPCPKPEHLASGRGCAAAETTHSLFFPSQPRLVEGEGDLGADGGRRSVSVVVKTSEKFCMTRKTSGHRRRREPCLEVAPSGRRRRLSSVIPLSGHGDEKRRCLPSSDTRGGAVTDSLMDHFQVGKGGRDKDGPSDQFAWGPSNGGRGSARGHVAPQLSGFLLVTGLVTFIPRFAAG